MVSSIDYENFKALLESAFVSQTHQTGENS